MRTRVLWAFLIHRCFYYRLIENKSKLIKPNTGESRIAVIAGTSNCHMMVIDDCSFVPGVWGPYKARFSIFKVTSSYTVVGMTHTV